MTEALLLALLFAGLLWVEWRGRRRSLRVRTAVFALIVLFLAQPSSVRAGRWAISAPPETQIKQNARGAPVSEYGSGVRTMRKAVEDDMAGGAYARGVALAALFWLAIAPILQRASRPGSNQEVRAAS